jgi:hypothetical protein
MCGAVSPLRKNLRMDATEGLPPPAHYGPGLEIDWKPDWYGGRPQSTGCWNFSCLRWSDIAVKPSGRGRGSGHRWAQSAMDRWIDTDTIDRYYRLILLVMLTTDSIDPSVKDFFLSIDSVDHRSQNPCQTDDHRSIGSLSTDGIDPSVRNRFSYHHYPE